MIDLSKEQALTLNKARAIRDLSRNGKRPDLATLYRWSSPRGCRGVRLESIQIGGSRCTTAEAVRRFIHALTQQQINPAPAKTAAGNDAVTAEAELHAAGF